MDKNKSKSDIQKYYSKPSRKDRDAGMPIFVGTVIHLNGEPTLLGSGTFEHLSWANEEGIDLSLTHTGRRGNGLELTGDTEEKRNLTLLDKVADAVANNKTYNVRVTDIKTRERSYGLATYYFFEEA